MKKLNERLNDLRRSYCLTLLLPPWFHRRKTELDRLRGEITELKRQRELFRIGLLDALRKHCRGL